MNDDDLEYLGVTDDHTKDLIMGTIDWLNLCEPSQTPAGGRKTQFLPDSGYTSVESISPSSLLQPGAGRSQHAEDENLLIVTPL